MTNLTGNPNWTDVPQLDRTTEALGGPGGPMNLQAQALADRTEYLKNAVDDLGEVDRRYTIGTYYFPGWSTPGGGPNPSDPWSLITTYDATRNPILGQYNEALQSINDTNFSWMRRFGIDFIALDWFMSFSGSNLVPLLDHVLNAYRASTVKKPKLCIQFANQTNGGSLNPANWKTIYNFWISNIFNIPGYYTIDGMPVVIVNSIPSFKTNMNVTHAQIKQLLQDARNAAIAAGWPGIFFMGGQANSVAAWTSVSIPSVEGWDGVTGSNIYSTTKDDGITLGTTATNYAGLHNAVFQPMTSHFVGFCEGWKAAPGLTTLFPPCTMGSDNTPWNGGSTTLAGKPTNAQLIAHFVACKAFMDANPILTKYTCMIQAWNESGEGAELQPTLGNGGFAWLEIMKNIFER